MKHKNQTKNFQQDYTNYYSKKINDLKKEYPEITKQNRRTGKALKNICFFIWYYAKEENDPTTSLLFKASVLLSAQDDFFDNLQISERQKMDFYSVVVNLIEGNDHVIVNRNRQIRELIVLWKEIIREMRNASPRLYSYWKKKAWQLNEAMKNEIYIMKRKGIAFGEYMKTAVDSIGIIFIWTTYLVKKNIGMGALQRLEPILLVGANIARLSNDRASWRQNKNKINAVSILKNQKNSTKYVGELIQREKQKLQRGLQKLKGEHEVVRTIQRSTEFLIEFYKTSDFDK